MTLIDKVVDAESAIPLGRHLLSTAVGAHLDPQQQPWISLPEDGRNFETQPPGDPWWASVVPTG